MTVEVPGLSRGSLDVTYDPGDSVLTIAGYRDDLSPREALELLFELNAAAKDD